MKRIYLDSAATNLVSERVLNCAERFASLYRDESLTTNDIFRMQKASLRAAREKVAGFIGCEASEIALMQSTSHSLGTLSVSLPLKKGDNVLVCDLEYQASVICWKAQAERAGFELKQVRTTGGKVTVEDFEREIDENTRVILLAAVQEINGYRADVKAVGDLARAHGLFFIVDGIQEAGARKVNVKELGLDIYCAGGKKWLGNPFGMGFMYVSRDMQKKLKPPYYSYYDIGVPPQYGDYLSYLEDPRRHPFDEYKVVDDASVFEAGGYCNFLGAMALGEAISVLENVGIENIDAHNIALNRYLCAELDRMGVNLQSPRDEKHMSSIVVFNFDGLKNGSAEKERKLCEYLRRRNLFVTVRCSTGIGGVRVSFHYYTKKEELDVFLDALREFISADGT